MSGLSNPRAELGRCLRVRHSCPCTDCNCCEAQGPPSTFLPDTTFLLLPNNGVDSPCTVGFWATGLSVGLAFQWTRPIPTQVHRMGGRLAAARLATVTELLTGPMSISLLASQSRRHRLSDGD